MSGTAPFDKVVERLPQGGSETCEWCDQLATSRHSFWCWARQAGHRYIQPTGQWVYACPDHQHLAASAIAKPKSRR